MHYLLLPGELRNAIYNALLLTSSPDAHTQTLRLSKAGVLVAPSLAHTNNLIRRELTSLLEAQSAAVLEAQAFDFDTAPLHAFLLANPAKQTTTTIKLTLHLTSPGAEKAHYAALKAFLLWSDVSGQIEKAKALVQAKIAAHSAMSAWRRRTRKRAFEWSTESGHPA